MSASNSLNNFTRKFFTRIYTVQIHYDFPMISLYICSLHVTKNATRRQ